MFPAGTVPGDVFWEGKPRESEQQCLKEALHGLGRDSSLAQTSVAFPIPWVWMRRALPTFSLQTVLSKRCWHSCPPVTSLPKPASPAACQPDREMPDCVEGLTDGYRGWDETALLLFASLLLPRVTKGLNRVLSSVTCWLSNRTLSIDENQFSFPFTLALAQPNGWWGVHVPPWRAAQSLQCWNCKQGDRLMPTGVHLVRWTGARWNWAQF